MERRVLWALTLAVLLVGGIAWWQTRAAPRSEAVVPSGVHAAQGASESEHAAVESVAQVRRDGLRLDDVDSAVTELLEEEVARASALRVRVLDGTPGIKGGPIRGARVELLAAGVASALSDATAALLGAETDEEGNARLADVPSGLHVVRVKAEGFAPHARELVLEVPTGRTEQTAVAYLLADGERVRGRLLRPNGAPLADALVCVDLGPVVTRRTQRIDLTGGGAALLDSAPHTRTAPDGTFELTLPRGFEQLALRICPGVADLPPVFRHELQLPQPGPLTLFVPRGARVVVRSEAAPGVSTEGRLRIDSGDVVYDLDEDPVVARLLSDEDRRSVKRSAGGLSLVLAPGVYTVRLHPASGRPAASFFTITEDLLPVEHVIAAGAGEPLPMPAETAPPRRR